jgi:hypothetical protein
MHVRQGQHGAGLRADDAGTTAPTRLLTSCVPRKSSSFDSAICAAGAAVMSISIRNVRQGVAGGPMV